MFGVDSSLATAYRKAISSFPLSTASDSIIFGANVKYEPFNLLELTSDQRFAIERAKKYALEQNVQNVFNKQAAHLQHQDVNTIKRNQALILLSRIYVGSISFEIGEDEIRKTFSPFGPIKSVALSWDPTLQKHKGYAFIEFEVPEAATLALEQMNGYTLAGRNLKVGRPSNAPQISNFEAEFKSDENNRSRIYVSSVHTELTESDLQTVFEAFGRVERCTLFPDPKYPGRHRGFGFIEFETEEVAVSAVSSMNCFDLAGQQLRVGRAITPKDSPLPFEAATIKPNTSSLAVSPASVSAVALAAASISAKVMSMAEEETAAAPENPPSQNARLGFSDRPAALPNLPPPGVFIPIAVGEPAVNSVEQEKKDVSEQESDDLQSTTTASVWDDDDDSAAPIVPPEEDPPEPADPDDEYSLESYSRILLLENMVSSEEVDEYLQAEVAEECSNYGQVLQVRIHLTPSSDVRIFVQFDQSDSAKLGCQALGQRFFAGRVVQAKLYDEERFQLHEFDD